MAPRTLLTGLLAIWLALFVAGFVHFQLAEPTGDGFTRGMNRIGAFLGWQGAAVVVALLALWTARRHRAALSPMLRRLGLAPVLVTALMVLGIVGVTAYLGFSG